MAQTWRAVCPSDLGHGSGNFKEKSRVTLKRRAGQATEKSTQMGKNVARKRECKEKEERMERHAKETRMPQRSKVSNRVEEGEFTGKLCFSHPETVKWSTGFIWRELAGAEGEQFTKLPEEARVSTPYRQKLGCQHAHSGCVGSVAFSGWWHLNQHFWKCLALGHLEGCTEQGGRDGAVSHVNAISLCMKYFYSACVKDKGARRKLLHYLVVDKMDEKVEVAE